jgi:hypothetical protein
MKLPTHSLLVVCVLLPAAALAQSSDYIRGYAQGVLDREFEGQKLQALNGPVPDSIVVRSDSCLTEQQRHDIGKLLVRDTIRTVEWQMPCPAAATAEVITEPSKKPSVEVAGEQVDVKTLPERALFRTLLADPREPRFSLNYQRHHTNDSTSDTNFDAADLSVGETFGFAEGDFRGGRYQIGLQGAVFALFNLDSDSFDLVNADYLLGFPVTWRQDAWSARVRLFHQSSHLGDEFLLGNPGVDRINLSYEVIDGLISREWQRFRLYGGGGVIVHSDPELDPWLAQFGAEYQLPDVLGDLDLTVAADFKGTDEQDWNLNQSYRAGFAIASHNNRKVLLLLQHYRGLSPNGQFFSERLSYSGFGFYFGF